MIPVSFPPSLVLTQFKCGLAGGLNPPILSLAPLFAQCRHENFSWFEVIDIDEDYQGKTLAWDKALFEACELLAVIHRKSTLLVALYSMVVAGSYQPQAIDQMKLKLLFPLSSSPTNLFGLTPYRGAR
ncbi:hypothetical protein GGI43DRAFT_13914 [Trichoderma evansii]